MTIRSYRITKAKLASAAFTGAGARTYGGRWNSPGTAMIYTAGTHSLAVLEVLVHLQAPEIMQSYVIFEVTCEASAVATLDPATLPKTWRRSPPPRAVQKIGDDWVAGGSSAVLRVPSAVVPSEFNYLLNPAHPDFRKIKTGPKQRLKFDRRLLKTPRD